MRRYGQRMEAHAGIARVTAAADQAIAARLSFEQGVPGWYVINPQTNIICGGPFPTIEQADEDCDRREDFSTVLALTKID